MLTASSYANWIYFLFSLVSNDSVDWWAAQWKSCSPVGLVLLLFALVQLNQKAVTHWGRPQIPIPFSVYYLAANISQLREDADAGLEEWEGGREGTATPAYSQLLPSAAHMDPVLSLPPPCQSSSQRSVILCFGKESYHWPYCQEYRGTTLACAADLQLCLSRCIFKLVIFHTTLRCRQGLLNGVK